MIRRVVSSFLLLLACVLVIAAQKPQESSPKPQAPPEPAANPVKQEPPPAPVVEAPKLPDELSVFNAAVISYNDNLFERAEKEFKDFQVNYPTSTNLSQAIVYQGLSLYRQEKYTETRGFFSSLLTQTNAATLPVNKDQYHYWIGMASLKLADYPGAITSFSELLKEHSNSSLVPNALYYTGDAWKMLGNTKRAIELFDAEGSLFLTVAEKEPNNIYVIQGRLLLAELFLSQNELDKARGILEKVATSNLPPELQWKRLFLLARVNLAQKDSAAATLNINSLLTLTTNAGLLSLEYQGLALQGDLLRQENKIEEAAAIYERNVANKLIPLSDRWQALMNTVRIKLELGKRDDAIRLLKSFNEESGNKPYSDELLATLGNLQMQDYYQAIPQLGVLEPGRGLKNEKILAAYANYTNLVTAFPKSTFLPKAQLNLGLCHWELSRPLDAMVCYSNAIASLPISEDNAFARIKLAEAQFYQKDFAAVALTIAAYMDTYANAPGIPVATQEQALHLQLCAAVENKNEELAKSTMATALTKYPNASFTERDLIYLGNYLCEIGKPAEARIQFQEALKLFPESTMKPDVSWLLARTWLYEKKFPEATKACQTWLDTFPKELPLYPLVEFELAWAYAQNGDYDMAMSRFSLYLNEHPKGVNAILARKWVADYYYNRKDFFSAEKNYQLIFEQTDTNNPLDDLLLDARMMAARSAFARSSVKDAGKHLLDLVNLLLSKQVTSGDRLDEALLLLGDTLTGEMSPTEDAQVKLARFAEAINAYSRIPQTNRLGAVAMSRIANCHFQLAGGDPPDTNRISQSILFYNLAMTAPQASVQTRSMAELGLATLYQYLSSLESLSQEIREERLKSALDHYLNVFQGKNNNPEEYDPFCVQRAGMEVARILEDQKKWTEALKIYERLLKLVPSLQPLLKLKMEYVQSHIPPGETTSSTISLP